MRRRGIRPAAAGILAAGEARERALAARARRRGPRWTDIAGDGSLGLTDGEAAAAAARVRAERTRRAAATRRSAARGAGPTVETSPTVYTSSGAAGARAPERSTRAPERGA